MPNNIATSINIGDPIGLFGEHYDIGVEAQNVVISYDADGNVIEDIEQTPPVTTKSLATVLKNSAGNFYGSSSTAANIATKTVAIPVTQNFSLKPGTIVGIAFINTNTANNPTINVNNSGAKNIYKGTSIQTSGDAGIIGGTVSFFQYNGTYWIWMCSSATTSGVSDVLLDGVSIVNQNREAVLTTPDIEDLSNVDVTSLTNGQILKYNSTTDKWENADESGGGGGSSTLAGLSDTNLNNPIHGQVLKYNSTTQKWINANESGGGGETILCGANELFFHKKQPISFTVQEKNWTIDGYDLSLEGNKIWTDGSNIYYSAENDQYIYDSINDTWSTMTWRDQGDHIFTFDASFIWTDGYNIYTGVDMSSTIAAYKLNKSTQKWIPVDLNREYWIADDLWSDGVNIHTSINSDGIGYIFDKENQEFIQESWTIPSDLPAYFRDLGGNDVWSDGYNLYASYGEIQCKLDKENRTWSNISWVDENGEILQIYGYDIWTDGKFIYYFHGSKYYVLQPLTNIWVSLELENMPDTITGDDIWTDGSKIYASDWNQNYEIITNINKLCVKTV